MVNVCGKTIHANKLPKVYLWQRTPQAKTPASVQFRPSSVRPAMSVRRVQQGDASLLQQPTLQAQMLCSASSNCQISVTGAAAASTPAQAGQKFLPKSQTSDLIAPSLANLPNALSSEYWLTKAQSHEEAGDLQVSLCVSHLLQSTISGVACYIACHMFLNKPW